MNLPDVVWHVFRVVSGGYNKVRKEGGGGSSHVSSFFSLSAAQISHISCNQIWFKLVGSA